jgi:hypothetical protein
MCVEGRCACRDTGESCIIGDCCGSLFCSDGTCGSS